MEGEVFVTVGKGKQTREAFIIVWGADCVMTRLPYQTSLSSLANFYQQRPIKVKVWDAFPIGVAPTQP